MHEHPNSASSWQMLEIVALAVMSDVDSTVCDMCAYGMVAEDADGLAPAEKRTRFLCNAAEVGRTSRLCPERESEERSRVLADEPATAKLQRDNAIEKKHRHEDLMNGRAKQCQV